MKRKKVLLIGDSLSLAREEVQFDETWPSILDNKLFNKHQFINIQRRGLTTKILNAKDTLEFISPDIIIIQLGIVDCAPRLLWFYEEQIISRMPLPISNTYIKLIKLVRKRNTKRRYISAIKFKLYIENYIQRAENINVSKIIISPIPKASTIFLKKNPIIEDSIKEYNNILYNLSKKKKILTYIEQLDEKKHGDIFLNDGYHINKSGHEILTCILEKVIDEE